MEQTENQTSPPSRLPGVAGASRLVAGIALLGAGALLASLTWATWSAERSAEVASEAGTRSAEAALARSLETLIGAGRTSDARDLVIRAGFWPGLSRCTLELPGGIVFADSLAPDAPVVELPERFGTPDPERAAAGTQITVPERGSMVLELVRDDGVAFGPSLPDVAVLLGTGLAFGIGLMTLHRRTRRAVLPLDAIRSALGALARGEREAEALTIAPRWGAEAATWNSLIAEREASRARGLDAELAQAGSTESPLAGSIEKALDAMSHGVVIFDAGLRIQYANGAAGILLQRRRTELPGEGFEGVCGSDEVSALAREVCVQGSRRRGSVEIERPGANEGDEPTVLRFAISRIGHGREGLCMAVVEDLTQQRVADRSRDTFVAHATHELRTPLTNIRLYMDTLQDEGETDPALRGRCLNVINQEVRRLERMVGDMLSVSEIEAGSMKLHDGDIRLEQLLEDLHSDYKAQAEERSIDLVFDLPPKLPVLRGDRDKLAMSLHNLIGNALKYTPEGGKVTVAAEVGDGVLIRVTDTGIGIGPEEAERVFERFYRSQDRRVSKITGTGLGLSLAREVVRLHGGDIRLESQLDKGSTFTLTLPLSSAAAA